jgi:hypothetical protein
MNMPAFDNRWTTGNLLTLGGLGLTILSMIVAASFGWAQMEARTDVIRASMAAELQAMRENTLAMVEADRARLARIDADMKDVIDAATAREARVRALELGAGRIEERLISIQAALGRIEKGSGQ